jgi:hypothetical protein
MYKYIKEGGEKLSTIKRVYRRDTQSPGARLARQITFVEWRPAFTGP